MLALFDFAERNNAVNFTHNGKHLGLAGFKQLFNSGKTGRDIRLVGCAAGVEGSHCKLSTGLTDGLSSDNTDCFAYGYGLARCKVCAVALDAYAVLRAAGKERTNLNLRS